MVNVLSKPVRLGASVVAGMLSGRGAAQGTKKLTGVWPGENGDQESR